MSSLAHPHHRVPRYRTSNAKPGQERRVTISETTFSAGVIGVRGAFIRALIRLGRCENGPTSRIKLTESTILENEGVGPQRSRKWSGKRPGQQTETRQSMAPSACRAPQSQSGALDPPFLPPHLTDVLIRTSSIVLAVPVEAAAAPKTRSLRVPPTLAPAWVIARQDTLKIIEAAHLPRHRSLVSRVHVVLLGNPRCPSSPASVGFSCPRYVAHLLGKDSPSRRSTLSLPTIFTRSVTMRPEESRPPIVPACVSSLVLRRKATVLMLLYP
ncbi:hypothetical protein HMN09_01363700 [Mycena chlorophos]|uniref:Uncharacterized protein n=1 Tax=Mycena chlorophos TaxID=658473 RepID=A0A8H6VUL3_MYCCL|nr:hypothetical protein HMN09_01363700 [Mycena chlorophos]